jgi:tetratricopeptide (TPR) repeat protein
MTQADASHKPGKGKAFFDRADEVAETGSHDFAIELYLEGIQREPENLDRGHKPLRTVSLHRKAKGGKPAGMMEQLKRRGGKTPLEKLVNAEYLLAKEPGNEGHMVSVLRAAREMESPELVRWIAGILLESQKLAQKRSKQILLLVTEAYDAIEDYATALVACEMALQLSPNDNTLAEAAKELSVKNTIDKGGYNREGDFTKGVKDDKATRDRMESERIVKGKGWLQEQIDTARAEYEESPTVPGKINALVDALLKTDDEGDENQAMDVLAKAHQDTGQYSFRVRLGDIRIKQANRRYRKLAAEGDKAAAQQQARTVLQLELAEYTDRAKNYPTDLSLKYELGRRQLLAGQYDEAIGSFQQARRDPRRQVHAMTHLGQAFARKGWFTEAAETFEQALKSEMGEDRRKDLFYSLGDVYEKMERYEDARGMFSDLAQLDFNYKDVRQRMEDIRKKLDAK